MTGDPASRLAKAKEFLRHAMTLDAIEMPEPVIHLSYYAMFHAALAVLTVRMGSPPTKHRGVISQFNLLVRDGGDEMRVAAKSLRVAFDRRLVADYEVTAIGLAGDAVESRDAAATFVQVCDELLREGDTGYRET